MTESNPHNSLAQALAEILKPIVKEAVQEALASNCRGEEEKYLTAEDAATLLSVTPDWLYRNSKKLPFSRRLGPKALRFSFTGIQKYLASRTLTKS
jgi:predicted DNA-binding transcriptional regulator AlpA